MKRIILALLTGGIAAVTSALLLKGLEFVTALRESHPHLIYGLPCAGLSIGWIFYRFGKNADRGMSLIIEEYHRPQKQLPLSMAPLIYFGTLLTHLFGGSAGREGTAVQMAASLTDQLGSFFKIDQRLRRNLLIAGVGAGFGTALGTPWAGALFGMEVTGPSRSRFNSLLECLVASFSGYLVISFLGVEHTLFGPVHSPELNIKMMFWIPILGLIFGFVARGFCISTHFIQRLFLRWVSFPPFRPLLGGLLLLVLFYLEGSFQFTGLGLSIIQKTFTETSALEVPFLKSLLTSLTVGSGFKGGEFVPLVFIGSTLGNSLSTWIPLGFGFLSALGFASVFAGASKTPLACSIMAGELFGAEIGFYAFITCYVSYWCSGELGIYKALQSPSRSHS